MGFGEAALKLSTFLEMKPDAKGGSATAGQAYSLHAKFDSRNAEIILSSAS